MRRSDVFRARRSKTSYTNSIGLLPTTTSATEVQMESAEATVQEATQTRYGANVQYSNAKLHAISPSPSGMLSHDDVLHPGEDLRAWW